MSNSAARSSIAERIVTSAPCPTRSSGRDAAAAMGHPEVEPSETVGHVAHMAFGEVLMNWKLEDVFTEIASVRRHLPSARFDTVVPELERLDAARGERVGSLALVGNQDR